MVRSLLLLTLILTSAVQADEGFDFSGNLAAQMRLFSSDPLYFGQRDGLSPSISVSPEFFWSWNEGDDSLLFSPYFRQDPYDDRRTHGDIRELAWIHVGVDWELRTGIRKVFWGVTEFQHLVDIINQTDLVEDIDGEAKLGQPMLNLSLVRDWGILDLYLLPAFRERTFPGSHGRLRGPLVVDETAASYESPAEESHVDFALRWSHSIGDYDLGIHWFRGTSRDPLLLPALYKNDQPVLQPYYPQIDQIGLDLQATLGDWLWKLETLHRDSRLENYWAAQAGFEYTLVGIAESGYDLGLLMEYGWDERGAGSHGLFQNDILIGTRLALNDAAGTEILAGAGFDLDYHGRSFMVEASRRFGDNWKLSLDLRLFSADEESDTLYYLRSDDHLQLTLERYF
jgi:hypothetical protein